jgi:hypothetical protein
MSQEVTSAQRTTNRPQQWQFLAQRNNKLQNKSDNNE